MWKAIQGQAGGRRAGHPAFMPAQRLGNRAKWCPPGPTEPPHRLLWAPQALSFICPPLWQPALPDPGVRWAEVPRGAAADPSCFIPPQGTKPPVWAFWGFLKLCPRWGAAGPAGLWGCAAPPGPRRGCRCSRSSLGTASWALGPRNPQNKGTTPSIACWGMPGAHAWCLGSKRRPLTRASHTRD